MWGWVALIVVTRGVAALLIVLFPFLGYWLLELTSQFMPHSLQLGGFWMTLPCGFLLMVVGVKSRKSASSSSHSKS